MEMLTKLEEMILISVWKLSDNAYGTTIYKHIQQVTGKKLSLGGVYFPLDRLAKKGYLDAFVGEVTEKRRGLSKRYYKLTDKGCEALEEIRRIQEEMWGDYSEVSFSR